jgi:hypothetical protein
MKHFVAVKNKMHSYSVLGKTIKKRGARTNAFASYQNKERVATRLERHTCIVEAGIGIELSSVLLYTIQNQHDTN